MIHRTLLLQLLLALLAICITGAQENPAAAPGQSEMQKWIDATDAQWQAAFKRDVTDMHEAELNQLKLQYLASLEEAIGKASKADDLKGALALRTEQKRFGDTQLFPEQDEAGDTAAVKQVRAALRALLAQAEKNSAARAKALHVKYDQVLAQAQGQLTERQRLDDALLVKVKRDEIAGAWIKPASTAPQEKTNPVTQPGVPSNPSATGVPTPASTAKLTAPPPTPAGGAEAKTFEMRMTGTTWSFPWSGGPQTITFAEKGRLILGWAHGAPRKWNTPRDGVIEVFPYSKPALVEMIRINASERTGVLTREGRKYSIERRK